MTIKGSLHERIAIGMPFSADFWSKIWLDHVAFKRGVVVDPIFEFLHPDLLIHYRTFIQ